MHYRFLNPWTILLHLISNVPKLQKILELAPSTVPQVSKDPNRLISLCQYLSEKILCFAGSDVSSCHPFQSWFTRVQFNTDTARRPAAGSILCSIRWRQGQDVFHIVYQGEMRRCHFHIFFVMYATLIIRCRRLRQSPWVTLEQWCGGSVQEYQREANDWGTVCPRVISLGTQLSSNPKPRIGRSRPWSDFPKCCQLLFQYEAFLAIWNLQEGWMGFGWNGAFVFWTATFQSTFRQVSQCAMVKSVLRPTVADFRKKQISFPSIAAFPNPALQIILEFTQYMAQYFGTNVFANLAYLLNQIINIFFALVLFWFL